MITPLLALYLVQSESMVVAKTKTYPVDEFYFPELSQQYQLDSSLFHKAINGYHELANNNLLQKTNLITIIDFTKSANQKRLWTIDLCEQKVLFHELVAHGRNTGEEFASDFSNKEGSYQSSIGFYVTGEIYDGKHDQSLKLHGVEKGFNNNAFDRGIVIHGADYVSENFIQTNGRLGRSHGCPAVSLDINAELIKTLADGSCLLIYYPEKSYLKKSKLFN